MSLRYTRRRFVRRLAAALAAVSVAPRPVVAQAMYDSFNAPLVVDRRAESLPGPSRKDVLASVAAAVASSMGSVSDDWGIAVRNLKSGQTWTKNADTFFPSASLYKLAVLYEVFRQVAAGNLSLDQSLTVQDQDLDEGTEDEELSSGQAIAVRSALDAMIGLSDNGAAHVLADQVGWVQLNLSMAALGLNHTRVPVGDWKAQWTDWRNEDSCTSPGDMLAFFDRLYHRKLVSPSASDQMKQLLLNDQINDRIPANLPAGTRVAHKVGNLDGVVNDAGIVYSPGADFIVVMLGNNVDETDATTAEASLARAIYDLFNT